MYLEISEKEIDQLLSVIEFYSEHNSEVDKEALGEIMITYWRLHRSKHETSTSEL
jgi:hypothetical protein|tara:strand:- start:387 stop:551 length:165 start_codon:yes stop_codon:yes gene_type:complete